MSLKKFSKKTSLFVSTALLVFFAGIGSAKATQSGWERPIFKSKMEIGEGRGAFLNAKEVQLIMTKQDGAKSPTGLILLIDDQVIHFQISKGSRDACGSLAYMATPHPEANEVSIRSLRLLLVDHSARLCQDYQPYTWEAMVQDPTLDSEALLEVVGKPEAVLTIQQ